MLQEILLALSGVHSSIWDVIRDGDSDGSGSLQDYISPSERAMLATLHELADLNIKTREASAAITRAHPSTTCRAVSNAISAKHLYAFQQHILHVESSILKKDANFVGAYNAVSLSTVVSGFSPWARRLRWLWKITEQMARGILTKGPSCSSRDIIHILERETHTGYDDLKSVSMDLLILSHRSWLQSITPWIIYGLLPDHGTDDFMIDEFEEDSLKSYNIRPHLVPNFVTSEAASSLLAIGQAFYQLSLQRDTRFILSGTKSIPNSLLSPSLEILQNLKLPIQAKEFEKEVDKINDNISQTALAKLLPVPLIQNFLHIVRKYMLFFSGEFAFALLQNIEERTGSGHQSVTSDRPVRKIGQLEDLNLNESMLSGILNKTWADLVCSEAEREPTDESLRGATSWIRLESITNREMPLNTLATRAAALRLTLPKHHPLSFFVSTKDLLKYEDISAYLLSIRRGDFQAARLWKSTSHRRCHPTPLGPPISASSFGQRALAARRHREDIRTKQMRLHWSTVSRVRFVLAELGNYFHGEVIEKSWECFHSWLVARTSSHTSVSAKSSRPSSSLPGRQLEHMSSTPMLTSPKSATDNPCRTDPRTIARAHTEYLEALFSGILANHVHFVQSLGTMLQNLDHYVALFARLQIIWQGLDLQEDEGVMDAFSNHAQDEEDVLNEMARTNKNVHHDLKCLMERIKEAEKGRNLADMTTGAAKLSVYNEADNFIPWRAKNLDRLIMKLEFGSGSDDNSSDDNLLEEFYDT